LDAHFKDFKKIDTDGTTRNGVTLRSRLLIECRDNKQSDGRVSLSTIKMLRTEFQNISDPLTTLAITDKGQAFNPDLLKALAACESNNPAKRSKAQLYAYLDTCGPLNQKELVVLLRTFVGSSPASSVSLRKHILEVLKAIVRLGLVALFPAEIEHLRDLFDETLALTWAAMKAGGMSIEQFWERFGPLTMPLGITADIDKIFAEEGSFSHVKLQINRVILY
jgi:hypothetical protein